eukprot:TRINITY_DN4594_c0_g1_i1.p1 TRINITY_DN4594_c0_g1~~TRINITY_DN4594_c0_g1_i1.p1  ORF type:complete len:305 (-),score=111.28 TRINITY_DN4594_c0_g1_i1:740-1654(-)
MKHGLKSDSDESDDDAVPEVLSSKGNARVRRRAYEVEPSDSALREDESDGQGRSDSDGEEEDGGEGNDEDEEEEGEGGGDDRREALLGAQMQDVPFEVLQKIRGDGAGVQQDWRRRAKLASSKPPKRLNKNRPTEVTSKKPVPRFRAVIEAPAKRPIDPRFESLSGQLDERRFRSAYGFLYSEQLPQEKERLKKLLAKEKSAARREEHKEAIKKIDQQLGNEARRKKEEAKSAEMKKQQREAIKAGKRPFFLKKSEQRRQALIEKYQELKASGKLEAFLAKRRRKNASREHKKVPYRRGMAEQE